MPSDPPTFFLVLVVSTLMDAVLLLWCWMQNRADRTLLWCSAAYALIAVGNVLLMARNTIADFLSIDLSIALVLVGYALAWTAGRVFNGKRVHQELIFAGLAAWLVVCRLPAFYESYDARLILTAVILATYCLATAREFWASDGLHSRYPIAIAFALHAGMVMLRIPLAIAEIRTPSPIVPFTSSSFGLMALEALIFAQAVAFLVVSLTKERVEARLRAAALTDPLTGLSNRRALFEYGVAAIAQSVRYRRPISVAVFDLDRFKEINDTYGHPVGDAVIRTFSAAARKTLRTGDHIGRIGGEEFAVILPDTDNEQACLATNRLMKTFADLAFSVEGCRTEATASVGVVTSKDGNDSLEDLLSAADRALYEGKRRGRNSLRVASMTPLTSTVLTRAS